MVNETIHLYSHALMVRCSNPVSLVKEGSTDMSTEGALHILLPAFARFWSLWLLPPVQGLINAQASHPHARSSPGKTSYWKGPYSVLGSISFSSGVGGHSVPILRKLRNMSPKATQDSKIFVTKSNSLRHTNDAKSMRPPPKVTLKQEKVLLIKEQ